MGRLIVIEGLDGCGKTTQAELLCSRLAEAGQRVRYVTFPDYEHSSSALASMYLGGAFGSEPDAVGAYAASSFFSVDRFTSFRLGWKTEYDAGHIIVANRYTTANAVHQMEKLPRGEWDAFLDWLFDFEYVKLGLPTPSLVLQLSMPIEVSRRLISGRYNGDETKRDIHERDLSYLERCGECAQYAAARHGWSVVQCARDGEVLPREEIAESVWSIVKQAEIL